MESVHGVIRGLIRQGLSASCPTASKGSPTVMALLPWQWDYMIHYSSLEIASNSIH